MERPIDTIFLIFFTLMIPVTVIDSQVLFPKWMYPSPVCTSDVNYILVLYAYANREDSDSQRTVTGLNNVLSLYLIQDLTAVN